MPTKARKVADVSGAGDTVISTLTLSLAAGADILEASYLANYAGGIVCGEVGIVPVNKEKLFTTIIDDNKLEKRDGMGIWETENINIKTKPNSKILLMEIPMKN